MANQTKLETVVLLDQRLSRLVTSLLAKSFIAHLIMFTCLSMLLTASGIYALCQAADKVSIDQLCEEFVSF